ncbi:hypothetical protein V5F59_06730 [Xanthobacter autotrophicus DSM 431]|uniref:hypothetical protein n=1 Tax=Xanthobacter nonsaccharivorans TaxID=3119912 RepID=UPI00372B6487
MFDPTTLTGAHTWVSLVAIAAGLLLLPALLRGEARGTLSGIFLATAFLTSASGFLFPFNGLLPSHTVGAIALVVVAVAAYAVYGAGQMGRWRGIYAGMAVASLYFLMFVGVAQAFAKVPALKAAAPTQSEPPFAVAQGAVLLLFIALGVAAVRARRA